MDFVTDQGLKDHQKGGKCPRDKYLPYPENTPLRPVPLPEKPKARTGTLGDFV